MEQRSSKKILIIYSDFYNEVSKELLKGAELYLKNKNISFEKKRVQGSLEIPFILQKFKHKFSGFVVLGCIIKGETDHYDVVKDICLREIYSLVYKNCIPLGCGILTVDNMKQALERADLKKKNLGAAAAAACFNLINIIEG